MLKQIWNKIEPRLNKKVVPGCHENPTPLLTRYKLIQTKFGDLNIHILHRSDEDREFHSHPWAFGTIILKNSYIEKMPDGDVIRKPGDILLRGKNHFHIVQLVDDNKPVITLNFMSVKKNDDWGFLDNGRFIHYKNFLKKKGCDI